MPSYDIHYGRENVVFTPPAGAKLQVLTGKPMQALPSVNGALRAGLADPFGCPPLKVKAKDKESTLIVVSDYTRYVAYERWLPELLDQLNAAGIPDSRIQLYAASGTHRAMTAEEKRERFSEAVVKRVTVLDHDCDAMERMKKIGRTSYGTVAYVDERVADAELLILTGGIQYHYFAGYSGGRKAIMPGCCARETVFANHRRTLDRRTGDFSPLSGPGKLVGNPVHEDMAQIANQIKPDMCINVVINIDKEVAWLGVGDHAYMLRRGAQFLDEHCRMTITRPADIAVIGAGGHPKDLSLFQAHKSLRHSLGALKPGALVLWLAKCEQGEGVEEFQSYRGLDLEQCKTQVREHPSMYSMCSLSIKKITGMHQVHLISSLPPEIVRQWGFSPHASLDEALAVLPVNLDNYQCLVAPDMSNLLPEPPGTQPEQHAGVEEPLR